jgi:hypothetical protein
MVDESPYMKGYRADKEERLRTVDDKIARLRKRIKRIKDRGTTVEIEISGVLLGILDLLEDEL